MPQLLDYPRYLLQIINGQRSRSEYLQFERMTDNLNPYLNLEHPLDILDLANGQLRPQYTILRAYNHRVTGIDFINRPRLSKASLAYSVARRIYVHKLNLPQYTSLPNKLLVGDVGKLPFPAANFNLVISAAAFEHFLDVPAVVAELHRILRTNGIAWVSIHPFTSPTGGHNLSFTEFPVHTLPVGVDAWDHLRKRRLPFTVPLNEWRMQQYLDEFRRYFEILNSYCAAREGEAWLTPAIAAELSGYSRDELTCTAFVIVARKLG